MNELKVKWPKVLDYNNIDEPPFIDWINLGNGTMFRLFAFYSHGGFKRPRMGLMVGLERVGCFLFSNDYPKYGQYVNEKLTLHNMADANIIADWINVQLEIDVPQQGIYLKEHILSNEKYGLIGENFSLPLIPTIIDM